MKDYLANISQYLFHEGTNYRAYEYLGAHREGDEYIFRVWAPNAEAAYVVGLFNGWSESDPMSKVDNAGIWECHIGKDYFGDGFGYKFMFKTSEESVYKCDPYAFYSEVPPVMASRFFELSGYKWNDSAWMKARKIKYTRERISDTPLNIYEVHAESWKKHSDGSFLTYKELAEELAPYAVQMGYTHIELLPVSEYALSDLLGYGVTGYYSPTSRFGDPKEFMEFIDTMHSAGIGVILDWVPDGFSTDENGLGRFDGGYVYELENNGGMEVNNSETISFDVSKPEVRSFLISNAMYWADIFHIDGLRVGAVSSILYPEDKNRSVETVESRESPEAVNFFRRLNNAMNTYHPDVMMIAVDSSSCSDVTNFERNGLGFTLKWNLNWENDMLDYASIDSYFRKFNYDKITHPMMYAFSEKYVLPVSHDEVSYGKRSFISKMPGDYDEKFNNAKSFMTYLMTQPGKKLSFMGNEIGQFDEWNYRDGVQWFLLDFDKHAKYQLFCAELNNLYLKSPALWENDGGWEGFSWVDFENYDNSIIAYRRIDKSGRELTVVINFAPVDRDYMLGVSCAGIYDEILASDDIRYGGSGKLNGKVKTVAEENHGFDQSIKITLPAYSSCIFRCIRKAAPKKIREKSEEKR